MFLFRNGHAAALLLVLTRCFVCASLENDGKSPQDLAKMVVSLLQGPWIERIDSVLRTSESTCADQLAAMTEATASGKTWALQMIDASSKIQSGIMQGNVRDLGMYDQCIKVNGQYNDTIIQGKYCTASFGAFSSAVCVPSLCNETDVVQIVDAVIQNATGIDGLELQIDGVSCVPLGSEDFTPGEILTIFFFSAVAIFIILCTLCEFVKICRPVGIPPIFTELAKFSLYTNAMTMLSTKVSPRMMPAIQGMRFLSMCWVVLGHRYLNTLSRPMINSFDILDWYSSWTAVYIQAAPFAVDTFFVISGFLMTYLFLKSKQSGKRSNFPMMYLHRYLRLTPCVGVLMLFVAVLLHRITNGPIWNSLLSAYVIPCRKNWWVNLLYVQNFVKVDEMCLMHSWYLAVDMQLFWISPIILYPLHRWPKWGLGILCAFVVASVVTPAIVLAVNGYSNALFRLDVESQDMLVDFLYFYIPTYTRACAYFVGMLLGYDVANNKRHFSQMIVAVNWAVACILMLLCGLATQRIYNTGFQYDVIWETAFAILLRPLWSIAIAWIVYACTFGYGGIVTRFLSLPIFLPLSRLSYCIYLVHMVIQVTKISATQTSGRFMDFIILDYFWGDLVLSIVIAFFFSLFFESPVVVLEKLLTNRGRKPNRLNLAKEPKKRVVRGIDNKGMTEA